MKQGKAGGDKPPNYDYTTKKRKYRSDDRRAKAYLIVKAIAQRTGYMSSSSDYAGLDRFLDEFAIEGNEIDWFEAMGDLGSST